MPIDQLPQPLREPIHVELSGHRSSLMRHKSGIVGVDVTTFVAYPAHIRTKMNGGNHTMPLCGSEPDRIVRVREATKIVGLSRSTIFRLERQGRFPKRIRLGPAPTSPVGWRLSDLKAWIDQRAREA